MINPRYNLKDFSAASSLILVILEKDGKRIKFSSGISVPPAYWIPEKQLLQETIKFPEGAFINNKLRNFKSEIKEIYSRRLFKGTEPDLEEIKSEILIYIRRYEIESDPNVFWQYFNEFVEFQRGKINPRTIVDYDKALRKHIQECQRWSNVRVTIGGFMEHGEFLNFFKEYFVKRARNSKGEIGFSANSAGKQFKNLKVFLKWCFEMKHLPSFKLKHIRVVQENIETVYLSENEIQAIADLGLSDPYLDKVRDVFLLGCETGLHFADYSRLHREHVHGNFIKVIQEKATKTTSIPINKRIRTLLNKYEGAPPNILGMGVSQFNWVIRRLCEMARINEVIVRNETYGKKTVEKTYKKYELVSSHTCRKSFCLNRFLNGVPAKEIMKISGHKTEGAFMKYISLSIGNTVDLHKEQLTAP